MAPSLLARMQGTDLDGQGSASDTQADTQSAVSEEVDKFLRSIVLDIDNGLEKPSAPGEIAVEESGLSASSTMNGAVSSQMPGEVTELIEEGEILDPPVLALYPTHLVSLVQENLTRRGGGSTIAPDVLQQKITELFTDDVCRSLAGLNKEFNAQLNAQFEIKLDEVQNALSSRVKTSDPAENGELAHSPDRPAVHKVGSDISLSDSSAKSAVQNKTLGTSEKGYEKATPMDQDKDEDKDKNNTSRKVTLPDRPEPYVPRLRRNSMNSSPIAPDIDVLYVPRRYSASFPSSSSSASTHNPRSPPSLYRDPDRPAPLSRKDERILFAHQMSQVAPHDSLSGAYGMKRKRDREDYLPYDSPASSSSSSRSRSRSDSPARYVHRIPKRREDLASYIPGHHRSAYDKHSSDTRSPPSMPSGSKPHTRTKRRRVTERQADWDQRESEKVDELTQGDTMTSPPMSAATPPASSTAFEPNDDIPQQHPNGLEADMSPPSSDIPSQNFSCPLPSLWDVKDGLPSPGILSIDFAVDPQTSTQLCIPKAGSDEPGPASRLPFRLQLLCTLDEAWNGLTFDPSTVTPWQMAEEVLKMDVQWPRQGDLIVQVNEGTPWCRTYMPRDLGPSSPPLDLTASVREGQNTIRLIQLSDMSRHLFVLHASSREQTPESTTPSADFYKLLMQPSPFATSLATH